MSSSPASLLIISCTDPDTRLDPARYFHHSARILKTPGARVSPALDAIRAANQAAHIGMIVVLQHTGCTASPGSVEENVRNDVSELKEAVRTGIQIMGYVLEGETGMLREVSVPSATVDPEARQRALDQMGDFGPFWS